MAAGFIGDVQGTAAQQHAIGFVQIIQERAGQSMPNAHKLTLTVAFFQCGVKVVIAGKCKRRDFLQIFSEYLVMQPGYEYGRSKKRMGQPQRRGQRQRGERPENVP